MSATPVADAFVGQLAQIVVSDTSLPVVLQRVADLAKAAIPTVADASVTLLSGSGAKTVASSGPVAARLDEVQYERGDGPCLDAAIGGEVMDMGDARIETRWPQYVKVSLELQVLCSLSVPLPLAQPVVAALNLYARPPDSFDDHSRAAARAFAAYAAVAIANIASYDAAKLIATQLETAIEFREVIDQAKGILMGQWSCTAAEAFDALAAQSQSTNRKVRELAIDMVTDTAAGRPPTMSRPA
jgi:GAF domain-containing protein